MLRREGIYFSRIEHGSHKVLADSTGFRVFWPSGPRVYNSARQTIMAIVNGREVVDRSCKDPCITFDRYFRSQGKEQENSVVEVISSHTALSISAPTVLIRGGKELSMEGPELGIDLNVYHKDIKRLFYAGFSKMVVRMGYDPEEVLQEVYKGILIRNSGKCPHDPRKSSLGHYVHMVAGCIISNYNRKQSRIRNHEQTGSRNEDGETVDFSISDVPTPDTQFSYSMLMDLSSKVSESVSTRSDTDPEMLGTIMSMMSRGYTRSEISSEIGMPPSKVSKVIRAIRNSAADFDGR